MIIFKDVSISFDQSGGMKTPALQGINLTFQPDKKYVIMGANGSGKSTILKAINGLVVPKKGRVEVLGLSTSGAQNIAPIRTSVQLVFQDPDSQLVTTVVEDEIAFGLENLNIPRDEIKSRIEEVIELFELSDHRYSEPHNLSGGQKQTLAIACAVAMRPSYLLLDEPTSMLDGRGKNEVDTALSRLKERSGVGIIQITHSFSDALGADEVLLLSEGKLIFMGPPLDIFKNDASVNLFESAGIEVKGSHKSLARIMRADARLSGASVSHAADYLLIKN